MNKAVIVCGGKAERMGTLTKKIPKSLLEIHNKPIIQHQLEHLKKLNINEVFLCVGHLHEQIRIFLHRNKNFGMKIINSIEFVPKGTAGAVRMIPLRLLPEEFIVIYGDILTDTDFNEMVKFHKEQRALATIAVRARDYLGSSLIDMDRKYRIWKFIERPTFEQLNEQIKQGKKNWGNAGFYVISKKILKHIPVEDKYDFAYNLFPKLLKKRLKIIGYPVRSFWKEIGTPERYMKAR